MPEFTFDYKLSGVGWADARMQFGKDYYEFAASYIDTPLHDLLAALLCLVAEDNLWDVASGAENGRYVTSFRWRGEPLTLCWDFAFTAPRTLQIELREAEDWEDEPQEPPRLAFTYDYYQFCRVITTTLTELINRHGLVGYHHSWRSEFPITLFLEMKHLAESGVPMPRREHESWAFESDLVAETGLLLGKS